MKRTEQGFSLLELLVVVSLIAVLMTIVFAALGSSQAQSRDAKRQADVRLVQTAVELYKNKYGHYPSACNGSTTSRTGSGVNPSGETGTNFACGTGNEYIVGLAPEFIPELPRSARAVSGNQGYVYLVNDEGSVYKFMALNVVEADTIFDAVRDPADGSLTTPGHTFHRCGSDFDVELTSAAYTSPSDHSHLDAEMCERTPDTNNGVGNYNAAKQIMPGCDAGSDYATTYAVSGGFATPQRTNNLGSPSAPLRGEEYDTEIVRCF